MAVPLVATTALAGPTQAVRKSSFDKGLKVILASVAPQKSEDALNYVVTGYADMAANKAIAIELVSGNTWMASSHEDASLAGDRTLEGCQLRYAKPCALIAVNEDIAADGSLAAVDMPRLYEDGKFDPTKIPVIRAVTRRRIDVQNYDHMMEPKAIAIHPWGKVFIANATANLHEAADKALSMCNGDTDRRGRDGGCFLYAMNDKVIISQRLMSAP
ncbi:MULTISPECIES: hypothetical protein [unclassified Bradyrhizobium]|uniref:hypothetical protein n=1 Tax=unclassified Bradyrhizobium TaxID=2631580 RepID=UPI0028E4634D|nr:MULTISPECIES: hypothetical protein [unclassified Bradyrhizobium]